MWKSLGWKPTGRSESFTHPLQSQCFALADPAGVTSSSSSMLITSMAKGTGPSSILMTEQGARSDAMAVSCGCWN